MIDAVTTPGGAEVTFTVAAFAGPRLLRESSARTHTTISSPRSVEAMATRTSTLQNGLLKEPSNVGIGMPALAGAASAPVEYSAQGCRRGTREQFRVFSPIQSRVNYSQHQGNC